MTIRVHANNAVTILDGGITAVATLLAVVDSSAFPTIGAGETFRMTLQASTGEIEIVEVTDASLDPVFTVIRGMEGTTAFAFPDGSLVSIRTTKDSHDRKADGAASSTDNAVARFDGTSGKVLQNSLLIVADTTGNISGFEKATASKNMVVGGNSTASGFIDFLEDTDNGSNKITLTAPSAIASDKTLTLPDITDTLVGKTTTDILTNKTFVAPILGAASATSINFGQDDLNYYDEGTWTPAPVGTTIAGSMTGTFEGQYIRVGKLVTITASLTFTSLSTASGNLSIGGLPFATSGANRYRSAFSVSVRSNFTNDFPMTGFVSGTGTALNVRRMDIDGADVVITDMSATSVITFGGSYVIN